MHAVSESEIIRALKGSRVRTRRHQGTFVLEPTEPFVLITIKLRQSAVSDRIDFRRYQGKQFYLVGREPKCPFPAQVLKTEGQLASSRCFALEDSGEVVHVLYDLAKYRQFVDHDFYLFPMPADFLIYASHHDEILFWSFGAAF